MYPLTPHRSCTQDLPRSIPAPVRRSPTCKRYSRHQSCNSDQTVRLHMPVWNFQTHPRKKRLQFTIVKLATHYLCVSSVRHGCSVTRRARRRSDARRSAHNGGPRSRASSKGPSWRWSRRSSSTSLPSVAAATPGERRKSPRRRCSGCVCGRAAARAQMQVGGSGTCVANGEMWVRLLDLTSVVEPPGLGECD